MIDEIIKKYKKQTTKIAIRMVYYKYINSNICFIYHDYG